MPLQVEKPHSHHDTRLVRRKPQETHLVAHEYEGAVRDYARDGKVIWEYSLDLTGPATPTHRGHGAQVYSAYRLPNGNTLIGGGNNDRVLEVDSSGETIWSILDFETFGNRLCASMLLDVEGEIIR